MGGCRPNWWEGYTKYAAIILRIITGFFNINIKIIEDLALMIYNTATGSTLRTSGHDPDCSSVTPAVENAIPNIYCMLRMVTIIIDIIITLYSLELKDILYYLKNFGIRLLLQSRVVVSPRIRTVIKRWERRHRRLIVFKIQDGTSVLVGYGGEKQSYDGGLGGKVSSEK